MVRIVIGACALALIVSSASAFVSISKPTSVSNTELGLSRRDALNSVGLAIGGILAGMPQPSVAAQNPALQTFKGRKGTKGQYRDVHM